HARAQRRERTHRSGVAFVRSDRLIAPLYRKLPFELTAAQTRAIAEIFGDMTAPYRMNRLLQGDVGSGKTIVALFAMLLAAENGMQSALMAPTEILAEQHARTIRALLEGIEVESVLLTGRMGTRERRTALEQIRAGAASIVIGTHALIQEGVRFHRLGLAIVDEQHRFGVRQRQALGAAGASGGGTIDKEPGLEIVLLRGRMGTRERRTALEQIRAGAASIVIGTHALIQEGVRFHRLGLAIVDEQHRFGVRQRQALGAAGASGGGTIDKEPGLGLDEATEAPSDLPPPDTLVMSATPIPRSLALTLYGDLDLTVIDELPPNRRPVRTAV